MGNYMQMIDLEEPMKLSKSEVKRLQEMLGVKVTKINKHVTLEQDNETICISNDKGGLQWVMLKHETFAAIAKELGYSLKRSSKS